MGTDQTKHGQKSLLNEVVALLFIFIILIAFLDFRFMGVIWGLYREHRHCIKLFRDYLGMLEGFIRLREG